MRNATTQRKHILRCPACGFTFDISYGRAFACRGCPSLVQCGMAKCPSAVTNFRCRISMEAPLENIDKNFELA